MQLHRLCVLLAAVACSGDTGPATPGSTDIEPAAPPAGRPAPLPAIRGLSEARDAYGDLLPIGAVQRFGMARLRHRGPVEDLAWTPDGKVLLSAGGDGTVRLWSGDTGRPIQGLTDLSATRLSVSPDGSVVAGGRRGGTVLVVSLSDGSVRWRYEPGKDQVNGLVFSPDGSHLALATDTGTHLLNATTGTRVQRFDTSPAQVDRVAWSQDGTRIAWVDRTGLATVRDLADGNLVTSWRLDEHGVPVRALMFTSLGAEALLATGSSGLALHDPATGEAVWTLDGLSGLTALAPAPEYTLLASFVDRDSALVRVDPMRRAVVATAANAHAHPIQAVAVGGARAATGDAVGEIRLWDARTLRRVPVRTGHQSELTAVAFSPDGSALYTAGADGRLLRWNVDNGTLQAPEHRQRGAVLSIAVSIDGTRVVSAGWDGAVREWRAADGARLRTFELGEGVTRAALRPDGSILMWSGRTGLDLVDVAGTRRSLGASTGLFAISPDGRLAVVNRQSGPVLLDLDTGVVQSELPSAAGLSTSVQAIAWAPDGTRFALVGADEKIHLVNVGSRDEELVLRGPAGAITAVAWSPDGALLATGHQGSLRLWDVGEQREIAAYDGHDDWVTGVAFSPDGTTLASAGADRIALLWRVPP